jgi:hypothetical protein
LLEVQPTVDAGLCVDSLKQLKRFQIGKGTPGKEIGGDARETQLPSLTLWRRKLIFRGADVGVDVGGALTAVAARHAAAVSVMGLQNDLSDDGPYNDAFYCSAHAVYIGLNANAP